MMQVCKRCWRSFPVCDVCRELVHGAAHEHKDWLDVLIAEARDRLGLPDEVAA